MKNIKIDDTNNMLKKYKHSSNTFIIAEIGVNHNGNTELAKDMMLAARDAGADCVKFQTFKADRVVTNSAPKAHYQLKTTNPHESQVEMLKALELSDEQHVSLFNYAKQLDMVFMSTPYNIEDVDELEVLGVTAYKLASISCVEIPFIKYVASKQKPVILSTGMATMSEVDAAVQAFKEVENENFILMQCTTNYPSRTEDTNITAMKTMADKYGCQVGYSDHTSGNVACIMSIALGASVIEKHFTTDQNLTGPDQSTSANPSEFKNLVTEIRVAEKMLGSGIKEPCEIELINSVGMRRSIVAKKDILAGQTLEEDMLCFKRPASGLSPNLYYDILGKQVVSDIKKDSVLNVDDFIW